MSGDQSGLSFEMLGFMEAEGLEKPFTEEEIFGALSDFNGDKAPARTVFSWLFGSFLGSSLRMR